MRRTKAQTEQTRNDILDTATRSFVLKGYSATSLNSIAKDAGVTRGAVYWHFNDKAEIFDAIFQRMLCPLLRRMFTLGSTPHEDPIGALKSLCQEMLEDIESNPYKKQGLILMLAESDYSGSLAAYKKDHFAQKEQMLNAIGLFFTQAKAAGQISSKTSSQTLAMATLCYLSGIITEHLKHPEFKLLPKQAPELLGLFLDSFLCKSTAKK